MCTSTPRNAADSRKRVTSTSSSKSNTLAPIPSLLALLPTSVSATTTQVRNWSGASTTQRPRTLRLLCGTSLLPQVRPTLSLTLMRPPKPPVTALCQPPRCPVSHLSRLVKLAPLLSSPKKTLVHSPISSLFLMDKTDSRPKRVSTSTKSKRTTTTLAAHTQVCTRTPSRSSQKNTNQLVLATSPASTTRKSRSLSQRRLPPPPCTCSRSTTTSSASNPVWAVLRSPTKLITA